MTHRDDNPTKKTVLFFFIYFPMPPVFFPHLSFRLIYLMLEIQVSLLDTVHRVAKSPIRFNPTRGPRRRRGEKGPRKRGVSKECSA
jgi:hypothetical protein